jgi:hypothetical protein
VEKQSEGASGQNRSQRVALLQNPGEAAAPLLGQSLKGERRAHAPLAAHGQPKKSAQDEQREERRGKGTSQLESRKAQNIGHQHGAAAIAVSQQAKEDRTHRAEDEGQKDRAHHRRGLDVKLGGDGRDAQDQDEVIE